MWIHKPPTAMQLIGADYRRSWCGWMSLWANLGMNDLELPRPRYPLNLSILPVQTRSDHAEAVIPLLECLNLG